jgi:hypothetical protein
MIHVRFIHPSLKNRIETSFRYGKDNFVWKELYLKKGKYSTYSAGVAAPDSAVSGPAEHPSERDIVEI